MSASLVSANEALFRKYDVAGSYYTTYPPLGLWQDGFTHADYLKGLKAMFLARPDIPLQLYFHHPFCIRQCWYCFCYQVTTQRQSQIQEYLEYVGREIDLLRDFFNQQGITPHFREIHFGGGSPTYMNERQFDTLMDKLQQFINIRQLDEFAIEIDPRTVTKKKMRHLAERGVTRISLGVQDFNARVQKAINRVQPVTMIEKLLEMRSLFKGINFDLIYGLPLQTRETLMETLEMVIKFSPDRITHSIIGYRPDIIPHHRLLNKKDLPGLIEKALMWEDSHNRLLAAGYELIGMGHFAKQGDNLVTAKKNKTLLRYANGYASGRFQDYLAIGVSSMIKTGNHYFQNTYALPTYYQAIANKTFPVFRGYKLERDDVIRGDLMHQLINYQCLAFADIERKYNINFAEYFRKEINALGFFLKEGIIELSPESITVTPLGYYFLRNICMVFDNLGKEYKHNQETADMQRPGISS